MSARQPNWLKPESTFGLMAHLRVVLTASKRTITIGNRAFMSTSTEPGPEVRGVSTRQRLVQAALGLFAEQGYEGTSVGEIESAAGLVPRSGALYKHFSSKRELLDAALGDRMQAIDRIERQIALLPLGEIEAELTLVANLALDELERERELAKIVMKDGDRFPGIATGFHEAVVARGHLLGREWLRLRLAEHGAAIADSDATAEMLTNSLVGFTLQNFMFGAERACVERERLIAAWVDSAARIFRTNEQAAAAGGPDD